MPHQPRSLSKFLPCLPALLALVLPAARAAAEAPAPVTVAVAANVRYVFDELAAVFRTRTGIELQAVSGSSGKIAAQVRGGAPFDVFLSADTATPEALFREGWAAAAPRVYSYGVLVLWTARDLDPNRGLVLLADPQVRKVAIANPRLAPYGRAAIEALEHAGLRAAVEPKLVYGESIGQATQFVESGAADIGFSAKSIVMAPELAHKGRWAEVPAGSHQPIAQAAVLLKHGAQAHPAGAQRFLEFLFTPEARAVFEKYGYRLP